MHRGQEYNLHLVSINYSVSFTFSELVSEMVREDLKSAERDELVKKSGYATFSYHE